MNQSLTEFLQGTIKIRARLWVALIFEGPWEGGGKHTFFEHPLGCSDNLGCVFHSIYQKEKTELLLQQGVRVCHSLDAQTPTTVMLSVEMATLAFWSRVR